MKTRTLAIAATAATVALALTGCVSDADRASQNLGTASEQFEIERRITAINGFTDAVMLEIEGRCSVETADAALTNALEITCKIGPDEYVKHFALLGDNGYATVQQLGTADVSVYHHRVLIKPENLLPEFDYEAGEQ
ncbi:hypothetical protein [Agrococcus sp. Marseille-Q4369]|uniref:beta-sandwich lipoprotein n=1 Tax=Agrococcus sp. Marseille-Q4369 TaxID=2810513 RepID=UPI001B8B50BD|nr:hypothetical protein [Agrococcus sp. Marseille-Q4369]QUW18877.1 hypothetical protein JSQ78_00375 [Agrococcus sp. Marseille-Q4369]